MEYSLEELLTRQAMRLKQRLQCAFSAETNLQPKLRLLRAQKRAQERYKRRLRVLSLLP